MALDKKEQILLEQVEHWLDQHEQGMVDAIMRLVNIGSVSGEAEGDWPYGKGCADVLDEAGRLAREMGFAMHNDACQYGLIHLPGKTGRTIGIFNHLDVVPPGDGWIGEPFRSFVRDRHIFGRGASDNKGPSVASLHVMKCLRDLGIQLDHTVTLYLGCNEEAGMSDMDYYLQHNHPPDFSLTPDAAYPACRGEKTRLLADLAAGLEDKNLLSFEGGKSNGAVPNYASMLLAEADPAALRAAFPADKAEGIAITETENGVLVEAKGIAAHGGTPEGSLNAVGVLAGAAAKMEVLSQHTRDILRFAALLLGDYYGEGPGIACEDFSGKLTHVGGITRLSGGQLTFQLNIKCPVTIEPGPILERLTETCSSGGFRIAKSDISLGYCREENDPVIQALNDACNQVWETDRPPFILGGGTYARKLPNALAFGCSLPGIPRPAPNGHGYGHQPDECVSIDAMRKSIKIYILSLLRLEKLFTQGS